MTRDVWTVPGFIVYPNRLDVLVPYETFDVGKFALVEYETLFATPIRMTMVRVQRRQDPLIRQPNASVRSERALPSCTAPCLVFAEE